LKRSNSLLKKLNNRCIPEGVTKKKTRGKKKRYIETFSCNKHEMDDE